MSWTLTATSLVEFIVPKFESDIADLEVWIPITQLRVESDLRVGQVEIRPISENLIDDWRNGLVSRLPDDNKDEKLLLLNEFFEKQFKKKLQGWSAGVIHITAEPIAAQEKALRETERSLAVLRLFSSAAVIPSETCYAAVLGTEKILWTMAIIFRDGVFSSSAEDVVDRNQRPWNLSNSFVAELRKTMFLGVLSELLSADSLTKFQEDIIDSVMLYSKATQAKEFSNKLVYVLSALEGLLLKNDNEPIQQNLGERLAILIGSGLSERKSIISNLKTIYGLRSAFLHHAQTIENTQEFGFFLFNAQRAMTNAISNYNRFNTKQGFISAIDDKKLS